MLEKCSRLQLHSQTSQTGGWNNTGALSHVSGNTALLIESLSSWLPLHVLQKSSRLKLRAQSSQAGKQGKYQGPGNMSGISLIMP